MVKVMQKRSPDIVLLLTIVLLSAFGILIVYSASNVIAFEKYNDSFIFFKRQFLFLIIGYIILVLLLKIDILKLKKYASFIFFFCLAMLLAVLIQELELLEVEQEVGLDLEAFLFNHRNL